MCIWEENIKSFSYARTFNIANVRKYIKKKKKKSSSVIRFQSNILAPIATLFRVKVFIPVFVNRSNRIVGKKPPLGVFHWHRITYRRVRVVNVHQVLFRYANPIVPETNPHVSILISSLNSFGDLPPPGHAPRVISPNTPLSANETRVVGGEGIEIEFFKTRRAQGSRWKKRARDENRVPGSTVRAVLQTFDVIPRLAGRF